MNHKFGRQDEKPVQSIIKIVKLCSDRICIFTLSL